MKRIAIFGAGGFGREVKMLIDQINNNKPQWQFTGFYDDGIPKGMNINGYLTLGGLQEVNNEKEEIGLVFAIGNPLVKKKIINAIQNKNVYYPILIHPNVVIGNDNVSIEEGCIICAGTIITVNIKIERHVILNLGCTVGHDTVVGAFSSFMPSVNISGEVNIGECVYGGTGAKIINQLTIGKNTVIGAGAVVTKTLSPNCTAVGVPAKPVKFNN